MNSPSLSPIAGVSRIRSDLIIENRMSQLGRKCEESFVAAGSKASISPHEAGGKLRKLDLLFAAKCRLFPN
jgi:hypothetical protein